MHYALCISFPLFPHLLYNPCTSPTWSSFIIATMPDTTYLQFDLLIDRSAMAYRARVLNSPAGQASTTFVLPPELMTTVEGATAEAVRVWGQRLFAAVFAQEVGVCYRRSQDEARRQNVGLRVRLRLADAPDVSAWPWETLFDPQQNRALCLSPDTSVVRFMDLPAPESRLVGKPPLRLLVIMANPSDTPPLEVEQEWTRLSAAAETLEARGLLQIERLEQATLAALQRRLRQQEVHILHFIGHGAFDPTTQEGQLIFEDEARQSRPVSGQALGALLGGHPPALVFLNACEGARASTGNAFAGVAQGLIQQGVPAVIAMQTVVTDKAAIALSQEFYGALADGYAVDSALAEARRAVFATGNDVEWAVPVLFMRAPDGRLFDLQPLSQAERQQNQIAALLRQVAAAQATEDWPSATRKLQTILQLDPSQAEAISRLRDVQKRQEMAAAFASGLEHYNAGRWRQALDQFLRVQDLGGNYRGVFGLLATAKIKLAESERPAAGAAMPRAAATDQVYGPIIKALITGRLVPILGPGVNLCSRPPGVDWQAGQYLPSTNELSAYLAATFGYPLADSENLAKVSQYVSVMRDVGPLYDELRPIFDADYPPTPVHQLLAALPATLRKLGYPYPHQLLITLNYDDVLERSLQAAGEAYDTVTYVAEGGRRGTFVHDPAGELEPIPIERPNEYLDLPIDQTAARRALILKIHGAIDRKNSDADSYVITEDHFINFAPHMDVAAIAPAPLLAFLKRSYFLFLGYDLSAWNLRTVLQRVFSPRRGYAWAVEPASTVVSEKFWNRHNVDILDLSLEQFVAGLSERLQNLPPAGGRP